MPEEDLSASRAAYAVKTPPTIITSRQLERPYQFSNSQLAQSSGRGFCALGSVLCWHKFHHSCCRLSIGVATMAQACLALHIVLQDFNWSHCPAFPVATVRSPEFHIHHGRVRNRRAITPYKEDLSLRAAWAGKQRVAQYALLYDYLLSLLHSFITRGN
jgi:hypothetical protein